MSTELQTLKAAVRFPDLVLETHNLDRTGKVICPFHDDHNPSCHVYRDSFHCFSCGAHGDALNWLKQVHGLDFSGAFQEMIRRAGGFVPPAAPRIAPPPAREVLEAFRPVSADVLEAHRRRAAQLDHIPASMQGRGFALDDLRALRFAVYGPDAVFQVTGPDGSVLALKRRYAEPRGGQRYGYNTPGHGSPAWCSPDFLEHDEVLVIEGELNAMACALARPDLAVMGVAGTNGPLHSGAFRGRMVYVYADGDEPGQKARDRWAAQALEAGAQRVFVLDPWEADACDLAGSEGRAALRERLS